MAYIDYGYSKGLRLIAAYPAEAEEGLSELRAGQLHAALGICAGRKGASVVLACQVPDN